MQVTITPHQYVTQAVSGAVLRAVDIILQHNKTLSEQYRCTSIEYISSKAENDYPNRFPSVAQVGPVSSGPTIASVRSNKYGDDRQAYPANDDGFHTVAVLRCKKVQLYREYASADKLSYDRVVRDSLT